LGLETKKSVPKIHLCNSAKKYNFECSPLLLSLLLLLKIGTSHCFWRPQKMCNPLNLTASLVTEQLSIMSCLRFKNRTILCGADFGSLCEGIVQIRTVGVEKKTGSPAKSKKVDENPKTD